MAVAARKRETERLAEEEHALRQHVEEVERKQEGEVTTPPTLSLLCC